MPGPEILIVDNFDSFTYTIQDYFVQLGAGVTVLQRPHVQKEELSHFKGVVFSPGPGNPANMPELLELVAFAVQTKPTLGICLGFQAIALHFGAKIKKGKPTHGKISSIQTDCTSWLYSNIPPHIEVVRYHSLQIENLLPPLVSRACLPTGELMAFEHLSLPVAGVQYHPEAYLTQFGHQTLRNWLDFC